MKPAGVNEHAVHVDGKKVATLWGGRSRGPGGVEANFGITTTDGKKIAEGYSYFKDAVKFLPDHLAEAGIGQDEPAPEPKPAKSAKVFVTPGNELQMWTEPPSRFTTIGGPDRVVRNFSWVSKNNRWHARTGSSGTMILTDRKNQHPTDRGSMQGVYVVKGKLPEVEAKIEELTAAEKGGAK